MTLSESFTDWNGPLRRSRAAAVLLLIVGFGTLVTPSPALVGPTSDPGALAAHVVMVLKRSANTAGFCSGVVVAEDTVLTAAHCVAGPADTRVHFRDEAGKPVLLAVAEVAVNPGYRAEAIRSRERSIDLALVRLSAPLPSPFSPAPLGPAGEIAVGRRFHIAGFGVSREAAAKSGGVLRVATLAARAPLSSILLWAEDPSGQGAGACTGDSGAPIFAQDDQSLVAVASWAAGGGTSHCGALTQAALVAPQLGWMEAVLRRWRAP